MSNKGRKEVEKIWINEMGNFYVFFLKIWQNVPSNTHFLVLQKHSSLSYDCFGTFITKNGPKMISPQSPNLTHFHFLI